MRKRVRFPKDILRKSVVFLLLLCMTIGSIYIPVMAEEENGNIPPGAESGDPGDLENSNPEGSEDSNTEDKEQQPEESKDDKKTDNDKQDEKNPSLNEEEPDKKEPNAEEDLDKKESESGEGLEEKEQEGLEGEADKQDSGQEIKEEPEKEGQNDIEQTMPEIINVVVPGSYVLALNPYGLPIRIGEDEVTTRQVISGNYGIINKSSADQIVMVSLIVEDLNEGELVFVDSEEEALNAEEGVYAVYLAAVPADGGEILAGGLPVNEGTTGGDLQNVKMTGAQEQAVTLYSGANQIAFKLSGAVYRYESTEYEEEPEGEESGSEDLGDELKEEPEIIFDGLASDGTGITAYTFYGAMNPNAPWEELSGGIKISVVYTYWTADGSEEVIEGTGAMISLD